MGARVGPNPPCPPCHQAPGRRWGTAQGRPRYRGGAGGKTFPALTQTPRARFRRREHRTASARSLLAGETVRAAARRGGVHQNTACRGRHRLLAQRSEAQPSPLPGLVAAAETDGLAAFTGRRDLPRPARQRGGPAATRRLSDAPLPVLIARDRTPATTAAVLASAHTPAVRAVLEPLLDPDGVRCADGSAVYVALAPQLHLAQQPVNRSAGMRVVDNAGPIQNVNADDSRRTGGRYRCHGVATQYLPHDLGWRRCLERLSGILTPERFLGQACGVPSAGTNT